MAGRPRNFDEEQVLQKAMLAFWRHGYERTGLVELEAATGLGRQSLYGAFGDKRALFERVVDHYFQRVLKPGFVDVLDAPGSPRGNLERLFEQWEGMAALEDFPGCLVGNALSGMQHGDEPMAELLRRKLEFLEQALRRTLSRAQEAGEVSAALDVPSVARALLTTAQGLSLVARVKRDPEFVTGVLRAARRLLLD